MLKQLDVLFHNKGRLDITSTMQSVESDKDQDQDRKMGTVRLGSLRMSTRTQPLDITSLTHQQETPNNKILATDKVSLTINLTLSRLESNKQNCRNNSFKIHSSNGRTFTQCDRKQSQFIKVQLWIYAIRIWVIVSSLLVMRTILVMPSMVLRKVEWT